MIIRLQFIFLSIFLASCGTTQYVKFSGEKKINQSKAKICVIRKFSFYAYSVQMKIYQDDILVGRLGPKSYLSWTVNPSNREIIISSRNVWHKDRVRINPKAGKTYYIEQKVKFGLLFPGTELMALEEEKAKSMLNDLKNPKIKIKHSLSNERNKTNDNIKRKDKDKLDKKRKDKDLLDVVYLKDGSIIYGQIVEIKPGEKVKIKTGSGSVFVYEMDEVKKIEKEKPPK